MAEKTRMKVCGLEFTREPSWLDRQALQHWTMAQHCSRKNTVLSVTLKRYKRSVLCVLHVGAVNDRGSLRNLKLHISGRSYRASLSNALDVARYPLYLFGFRPEAASRSVNCAVKQVTSA